MASQPAFSVASPALLLRLLLLLWQLRCKRAIGGLDGPTAARTSMHTMRRMMRSPLAVSAANAVRQHSLCAAERRPTVTPPGAKKRRNRTFAYRMTDSEVDPIIKNVQTIEKTTDPALDLSLAERVRLDLSWPEIGHFRCRT